MRVSIFMWVFDVHINRTPIAGTIRQVVYISGKFLNADLDKASEENERQHFLVEGRTGARIGFTQIAGLVARRIVPFVKAGDMVVAGQRDRADPLRQPGRRLSARRYARRRWRSASGASPARRDRSAAVGARRAVSRRLRSDRDSSRNEGRPSSRRARLPRASTARPAAARGRAQCGHRAGALLGPDRRPLRDRRRVGAARWR